jgi:hypothetical protein
MLRHLRIRLRLVSDMKISLGKKIHICISGKTNTENCCLQGLRRLVHICMVVGEELDTWT